jgi:RNA polymerase sigma factor (sigma-70 family)
MPALRREDIDDAYRKHGHSVLRRARFLLGKEEDAIEALHEVFVDLIERPEQFENRSSIVTWLYSATTHLCLNRLRNGRTRTRLLQQGFASIERASAGADIESGLELRRLLDSLPRDLAEVAVYHHMDELTQDEIANVMGCSRRHVGHLLQRLRTRLAETEDRP